MSATVNKKAQQPMDRIPGGSLDVRPPLHIRVPILAIGAGLIGASVVGIHYSVTSGTPAGLGVTTILLSFGLGCWRLATARLHLDSSKRFVVRNYFGTTSIPVRDVERFEIGSNAWGIELWRRDSHEKVVVNAIQKSNWASLVGKRSRADLLVAQLNEIINMHENDPPG